MLQAERVLLPLEGSSIQARAKHCLMTQDFINSMPSQTQTSQSSNSDNAPRVV
jgi:hypothetical protein